MTVGRSTSPTHRIGAAAEDVAANFLCEQGFIIIAKNFNSPFGEIDLIVVKDNLLIFVEVRHRKANSQVSAAESVTQAKQRKITRTAEFFLQQGKQYQNFDMRFDLIISESQTGQANSLEWIEHAFYSQ